MAAQVQTRFPSVAPDLVSDVLVAILLTPAADSTKFARSEVSSESIASKATVLVSLSFTPQDFGRLKGA